MSEMASAGVQTVVDEWRITGDPGKDYPYYSFVLRSDDPRWRGDAAKTKAHEQVAMMAEGNWDDGPHLSHRTVTYTEWVRCER